MMRSGCGLALAALAGLMTWTIAPSGASAQATTGAPKSVLQLPASTVLGCVTAIESRTANGRTVVSGRLDKSGGGLVVFFVTAAQFTAGVNPTQSTPPFESEGWTPGSTPDSVSALYAAGAGKALVSLQLGAGPGPFQPVNRVTVFFADPACKK